MTEVRADDELPFSLDWLAGATTRQPVSYCPAGHLVVNDRTHWAALRFSADGQALWCRMVERGACS